MPSLSVFLRKEPNNKTGKSGLYIRYIDNRRKKKDISLKLLIPTNEWNEDKRQIKRTFPEYQEYHRRLMTHVTRANQIIINADKKDKELSAEEFARIFTNAPASDNFVSYAKSEMERSKHLFSQETLKAYRYQTKKIQTFAPDVKIHEIDLNFIRRYEEWLITERRNQPNTVWRSMAWLKAILNRALRDDIIEKNPFARFKLSKKPGRREFLTLAELKVLEALLEEQRLKGPLRNVLQYFLFSCYTGLRYQDIKDLTHADISNDIIRIKMHKTQSDVSIPLMDKAKALIPENPIRLMKVFRVVSNQKTNHMLKEIMELAGIEKEISFHCARHTFATVGITIGIPMEIISKLLGHSDLKTTQIYAKIVDEVKIKEMSKWNSI